MKKLFCIAMCLVTFLLTGCRANPDILLDNPEILLSEDEYTKKEMKEEGISENIREEATVYVYIYGAVNAPGVYELKKTSRVFQLIEAAGGFTDDADRGSINLADFLEDGQMIRILTVEESQETTVESMVSGSMQSYDQQGRVDINSAGIEQLMTLNGIGETKAQAIVTYRQEHGPFQTIEDLICVDGIGEGTLQKIKDKITV